MHGTSSNHRRLAAWAGVIGPTLFVAIFTLEGLVRSGYSPRSMYVSALSLGPRGWIQIINFVVFGLLLLVFARGTATLPPASAARRGPLLLTTIALGYLLSGPFVMDPMGTPQNQMSVHGLLHGIFGAIVFVLMPVTCFVYLRRFRADANWYTLRWWTLVLGTISAAGSILLSIATKVPANERIFHDWLGLIQRTAIVPFMIWLAIVAVAVLRRTTP